MGNLLLKLNAVKAHLDLKFFAAICFLATAINFCYYHIIYHMCAIIIILYEPD